MMWSDPESGSVTNISHLYGDDDDYLSACSTASASHSLISSVPKSFFEDSIGGRKLINESNSINWVSAKMVLGLKSAMATSNFD